MDGLQFQVRTSIAGIDPAEWTGLENKRSFYQCHPWLSWAEENPAAQTFYVLARDSRGTLVGAVPTYLMTTADTSWNSWYDPLTVFTGHDTAMPRRRLDWFPVLLVGSIAGYHSDILVDLALSEADRGAVMRALVHRCRALANTVHARSMALMYAPEPTVAAVSHGDRSASRPVLTSASPRIKASWTDFDAFLQSFPRRRRYNIHREIVSFRASGSQVAQVRLSDCLQDIGPLLGNVHRKHGLRDTDADTTSYIASQAAHLDGVSRVFLELVDGRPVGFSLCYEWGRELHVRVVGFDYERSARFAYFNLAYYLPLDYAIRRGLDNIHLGPGTYDAKVGRGAVLDPTWSLVWPPDEESGSWFEAVQRPGEDAREAAPWLPASPT